MRDHAIRRNDDMKIKRIEHVAIAVKDLEGSKKMLTDLFGLNLEYEEEINATRLAMFPVGESYLELLQSDDANSKTAKWIESKGQGLFHICLEVDDIVGALSELKSKGAKLLNEVPVIGHGNSKIAFIDPESTAGFLVELVQPSH
jgi:methylmalonyl-CoA/ethylmalonyl-CoA epimerase